MSLPASPCLGIDSTAISSYTLASESSTSDCHVRDIKTENFVQYR